MSPSKLLRRLCNAYDRIGNDSLIVDFRQMDRWYAAAERAIESSFASAESDGLVRTALCRCLTCYFYQSPTAREDEWYTYLTTTADDWTATLSPAGHWEDLPLAEALERIEVLNRISYMMLDHSRDEAIRLAYTGYAVRVATLSPAPTAVLERWYTLCTEGNAIPFNPKAAIATARRLSRMGRRKYDQAEKEMRQWMEPMLNG